MSMKTVICPTCGMQTSAEELSIAEAALAEHVKTHAGDGFSPAQVVTMLDELKALKAGAPPFTTGNAAMIAELRSCLSTFLLLAAHETASVPLRQQALYRAGEIRKLLS